MTDAIGMAWEEKLVDPAKVEDADVGVPIRDTISSYGADYPVDGLVKRLRQRDIYIPEFQREFVLSAAHPLQLRT